MTRIRSCVLVILFVLFLLCVFILFSLHTKSLEEQAAFAALAAAALPTEEKNVQESLPDASALTDIYAAPYSEPIKQTDDLNFEPPAENAERFYISYKQEGKHEQDSIPKIWSKRGAGGKAG